MESSFVMSKNVSISINMAPKYLKSTLDVEDNLISMIDQKISLLLEDCLKDV